MLAEDGRWSVVHNMKLHGNVSKVAKKLCISRDTVRHWWGVYQSTGCVAKKAGSGRKRCLDDAAVDVVTAMLESGDFTGTSHVAVEAHTSGLVLGAKPPHKTTTARRVKARAKALGKPIRAVRGQPAKELTPHMKDKRLQFCEHNKSTSWARTMFTDRKRFLFKYPGCPVRRYAWVRKGERRVARKVNKAMSVNVYAGITKFGITKLHCVAGTSNLKSTHTNLKGQQAKNITKSEYVEVLQKTLLPEGTRLFRNVGVSSWVFQQDNDPSHKAAGSIIQAWNSKQPGVQVALLADWPGNSPDLNPIENLWAWAQAEVDAKGCQTFPEFKKCVFDTLQNAPRKVLRGLVGSMGRRVRACVENHGGKTKY
jgi:DDE superfamily endonuclease